MGKKTECKRRRLLGCMIKITEFPPRGEKKSIGKKNISFFSCDWTSWNTIPDDTPCAVRQVWKAGILSQEGELSCFHFDSPLFVCDQNNAIYKSFWNQSVNPFGEPSRQFPECCFRLLQSLSIQSAQLSCLGAQRKRCSWEDGTWRLQLSLPIFLPRSLRRQTTGSGHYHGILLAL